MSKGSFEDDDSVTMTRTNDLKVEIPGIMITGNAVEKMTWNTRVIRNKDTLRLVTTTTRFQITGQFKP